MRKVMMPQGQIVDKRQGQANKNNVSGDWSMPHPIWKSVVGGQWWQEDMPKLSRHCELY